MASVISQRVSESFLRPSTLDPGPQGFVRDVEFPSKLSCGDPLTEINKESVSSCVVGLSDPCRPFTIIWGIIGVVVLAIKAVERGWSWTEVSVKVFKGVPPFANSDSPCPISIKHIVVRVGAALMHMLPSRVFRAPRHSMRDRARSDRLQIAASARAGIPIPEIFSLNKAFFSAVALAGPKLNVFARSTNAGGTVETDNDKSCKSFSGQINKSNMPLYRSGGDGILKRGISHIRSVIDCLAAGGRYVLSLAARLRFSALK